MAPELFYNHKITAASDVWAYGMTILVGAPSTNYLERRKKVHDNLPQEILTSKKPYARISLDPADLQRITDGYIPPLPFPQEAPSMTPQLWSSCRQCWTFNANERPPISQIAFQLANDYELRKAAAAEVRFRTGEIPYNDDDDEESMVL
jgi:serine/threonine protein kinase